MPAAGRSAARCPPLLAIRIPHKEVLVRMVAALQLQLGVAALLPGRAGRRRRGPMHMGVANGAPGY